MSVKLITARAVGDTVITLAEAKTHCRVTDSASDDYITTLIMFAQDYIEARTGIALGVQTYEYTLQMLPIEGWIGVALPRSPVISVIAVEYRDEINGLIVLDAAEYSVDFGNLRAVIYPVDGIWPDVDISVFPGARITFTAGNSRDYGSPLSPIEPHLITDERIVLAAKMIICGAYDKRLDAAFLTMIDAILASVKRELF